MTVVVVGSAQGALEKVSQAFSRGAKASVQREKTKTWQKQTESVMKTVEKNTNQAYAVLGYRTVPRCHPDSYALDVLRAILGRGQSGRIFDEVRNKRGLAYDVGVHHNPSTDFGFFSVYVNTDKSNLDKVKEIILKELKKPVSEKEVMEAKTYLEGEFLFQSEDNQKYADLIASWEQVESSSAVDEYMDKVNAVTKKDVEIVVDKYLDYHTMVVLK